MEQRINYWTIPCNINDYDVVSAFKELKTIEWKQVLSSVCVGDIVYIYVGKPYSQILYKCKINKVNLDRTTIDDKKFWSDPNNYGSYKRYMEIEPVEEYFDIRLFGKENLKQYGLSNIQSQASADERLVKYIENIMLNGKRVSDKKSWVKVLKNEKQENNMALDILLYLYDCKDYTSNEKNIAKYFNITHDAVNSYIQSFGKRVIDLLGLKEQVRSDKSCIMWNIPFETIPELNQGSTFTWKLRNELVDALVEKYDLIPKEKSIDEKMDQFIKDYPYDRFCEDIKKDIEVREHFVNKFTVAKIMNMSIDDYAIGRADIDLEHGKDTFCYLIERRMENLGGMRGSTSKKFGVWYVPKEQRYKHTDRFGSSVKEAFEKIRKEIVFLLISANNDDYEGIESCKIASVFKGKILSTYFPEKYLCIFNEEDIDKFLNILDIRYDLHERNTLEKKKELLQEYKNKNKTFKNYSDYYFVVFLYRTFKKELETKNTIAGEIDYDIQFVDFEYIQRHPEKNSKNNYRSRETDYEKINRNKKNIGNRGENAVLINEINKLKSLGLNDYANQVCIPENDACGYDIRSFDENGNEIHIEVKTNSSNKKYLDFYITQNELEHLMQDENYYIYYLFDIKNKHPKCHIINKQDILDRKSEFIQPVIYKVNIDVMEKTKSKQ